MKIFLTLLVLLFSSSVLAEDISDFQIEEMSLGDSLLDFVSEQQIINNKINYSTYKDNKFYSVDLDKIISLKVYEGGEIYLKTNDKKYVIYSIFGAISFNKNTNACYKKKDEIVKELSMMFREAKKNDYGTYKHRDDPSGKSKVTSVKFKFKSGDNVNISCYDWSKEIEIQRNWIDHLAVSLDSKEFSYWLINEAY